MIRTQIQLEEQQYQMLKVLSGQQSISIAELVRRALMDWLRANQPLTISRQEQRQRAIAAAGRFHSGKGDLAANHDAYFVEAIAS